MATIDADAHVIETPATWAYMEGDERRYQPQIFRRIDDDGAPREARMRSEYWIIDGRLATKENVGADVPEAAREMADIDARLAHMDEIGIDVQVLFPSIFLRPITREHYVEFPLIRSYNRWLADIWARSDGRLRWVAMPPLLSLIDPGRVRDELAFCKDNGACGIFMRGLECDRQLTNPYFFPLYEMAAELDLPLCLHAGNNHFEVHDALIGASLMLFKFPVIGAFNALLEEEIPSRFPGTRWGFIEASAQWVPYVLGEVAIRLNRRGKPMPNDILVRNNFFITTQRTDDLPWLLSEIGDDSLLIGTDYGHRDTATEVEALKRMRADGSLGADTVTKILETNPARLYGL